MGKSSGGGGSTGYIQSPQQQQLFQMAQPLIQKAMDYGMGGIGQGGGLWPTPGYNIPSTESMMPSAATMGNISPSIWEGIMNPYKQAEQQLMETLGAGGGLGSARGGFSGQGAAGLGKFWAEAAPTMGTQAWNMISPALQQGWGAGFQREQALWGEQMQQHKYPWQAGPSMLSMGMPTPYTQQQQARPLGGIGSLLGGIGSLWGAI